MEYDPQRSKKAQVADNMRDRISAGYWQVGQSVGDMFRLAEEYGVSFGTVRAAEEILVKEGLLSEIRAGMPTRVVAMPSSPTVGPAQLGRLRTLHRDLGELIAELEAGETGARGA